MEVVLIFLCSLLAPTVLASGKYHLGVGRANGSHSSFSWKILVFGDLRVGGLSDSSRLVRGLSFQSSEKVWESDRYSQTVIVWSTSSPHRSS